MWRMVTANHSLKWMKCRVSQGLVTQGLVGKSNVKYLMYVDHEPNAPKTPLPKSNPNVSVLADLIAPAPH